MDKKNIETLWDVKIPMRDGVRLPSDIYLPEEESGFPSILGFLAASLMEDEPLIWRR